MTGLSPEARKILEAGRAGLAPSEATKAEVFSALQTATASSTLAPSSGGLGSAKLLLALVLAVGIGGAFWLYSESGPKGAGSDAVALAATDDETGSEGAAAAADTATASESAAGAKAAEDTKADAEAKAKPAKDAKAAARRKMIRQAPKTPGNTLLAERKLIGAAQVAIRNKNYQSARRSLAQHKREFPSGILAPERDAAQAISLCLDPSQDKGPAVAKRFLRRHKNSPLSQRVKSSCDLP